MSAAHASLKTGAAATCPGCDCLASHLFDVLSRPAPVHLVTERNVICVLCEVRVKSHPWVLPRQRCRPFHAFPGNAEWRARRHTHAQHAEAHRVVKLADQAPGISQRCVCFFHALIWREAPCRGAQIHHSPSWVEAHAYVARSADGIIQSDVILGRRRGGLKRWCTPTE